MNRHTDAFLAGLYVIVDDWYLTQGVRLLSGKVGAKPIFSDSEVMTLALAHHGCGFRSEREWLRYVRNHHADMFPHLLSQSEFNRRARNLCWLLNQLRLYLLNHLGVLESAFQLIDGTPIHGRHWRR